MNIDEMKKAYVGDQARITELQSLVMRMYETWWPLVSKHEYTSLKHSNLRQEILEVLHYTASDATTMIKAQGLREVANTLPREAGKVWTTEQLAEYLVSIAEISELEVKNSIDERIKDVPF